MGDKRKMNDLKGIIEDCNKGDLVSNKIIKKIIKIIGQEEWQILHDENNDICTTMGELIITLKGIVDLEKENAELKVRVEKQNADILTLKCLTERQRDQLTNAKEIIREFIKYEINEYDGSLEIHFEELKKQAEQFLKGE